MKQETLIKNESGIFSEAEIKSLVGMMEILDSKMPLPEKRELFAEAMNKHCEMVLGVRK